MKRKIVLFLVFTLLISQLVIPVSPVNAASSVVSSPGLMKVIDGIQVGPNNSFTMYGFVPMGNDAIGTEYTVVISTDSKPLMVVGTSDVSSWSYNDATQQLTVIAKSVSSLDPITGQVIENFVGISFGDPGATGPGAAGQGMYIATNSTNWNLQPGDDVDGDKVPDTIALQISGKAGTSGFFEMFWPTALLSAMDLTPSQLVGFVDGDRVNSTVTEVSSGAIIRFEFKYNSGGGASIAGKRRASLKTLDVAAGQAETISLNADKASIKKKKGVKLYGWVSPKKKNAKVDLFRKYKGEKRFKKIATVRTNSDGYFKRTDKPKKTATYMAKHTKGKKTYSSSSEKVVVI